jgi:hypothetical protein
VIARIERRRGLAAARGQTEAFGQAFYLDHFAVLCCSFIKDFKNIM